MCKSLSEGGQRCAAHTRPRYEAATFGSAEWSEAAAAHASTKSGRKELTLEAEQALADGDVIGHVALASALRDGARQRLAADEATELIRLRRASDKVPLTAEARRALHDHGVPDLYSEPPREDALAAFTKWADAQRNR